MTLLAIRFGLPSVAKAQAGFGRRRTALLRPSMFEDGRNEEEEGGADWRYPSWFVGTDLAAATRPLHWKDTGNPTRGLVAAPASSGVPRICWRVR